MVKVFNSRNHGFAHVGLSSGGDYDEGAADGAGGKKKDVTSDSFL